MSVAGKLSESDLTLLRVYSTQPPSVEESAMWAVNTAIHLNKRSLTKREFEALLREAVDRLAGLRLLNKLEGVLHVSELGKNVLRYLVKP